MGKVVVGIKDFQSIRKAKLEFLPGITVISGANNSGKTAIVRAIQALIENPLGATHLIRDDQPSVQVGLRLGGTDIYWLRERTGCKYKVGSSPYSKCGRNDVYDFMPDIGMVKDPTGRIVNIHDEWDQLFPFHVNSGQAFKIFEGMFDVGDTKRILHDIRQDVQKKREQLDQSKKQTTLRDKKIEVLTEAQSSGASERLAELLDLLEVSQTGLVVLQGDRQEAKSLREVLLILKDLKKQEIHLETVGQVQELESAIAEASTLKKWLLESKDLRKKDFDLNLINSNLNIEKDCHDVILIERFLEGTDNLSKTSINLDGYVECLRMKQAYDEAWDIELMLRHELTEAPKGLELISGFIELKRDCEEAQSLRAVYMDNLKVIETAKAEITKIREVLDKVACPTCGAMKGKCPSCGTELERVKA